MSKRFLWLLVPTTAWERTWLPEAGAVIHEGPRDPFSCIMLADDRETGLFARKALPRPTASGHGTANGSPEKSPDASALRPLPEVMK